MNRYLKWIDKKEFEGFERHADIKSEHPFSWGLDHLGLDPYCEDPYAKICEYNNIHISDSHRFFRPKQLQISDFRLENNVLSFPSSIKTHLEANNIARMQYYPARDKTGIVIVVPHWNAPESTYHKICSQLNRLNFASLRVTLPYHDIRGTGKEDSSTRMVSANIGLTIQAMRQSVLDIIASLDWLEYMGYKRMVVMGASIGSCTGFIAACHDKRINGFFANMMSSYFGDVVWTGLSTKHIKESFEQYNAGFLPPALPSNLITRDKLREAWMLNSPIAYVDKISSTNPALKQFIVSGKYDTTFKLDLTLAIFDAYNKHGIHYEKRILPCGHYSLASTWFKYIDAYYIYNFMRSLLRN